MVQTKAQTRMKEATGQVLVPFHLCCSNACPIVSFILVDASIRTLLLETRPVDAEKWITADKSVGLSFLCKACAIEHFCDKMGTTAAVAALFPCK